MSTVSISQKEVAYEVTVDLTPDHRPDHRDAAYAALRAPAIGHPVVGGAMQESSPWDRLWFALGERTWATVALVPAAPGQSTLAAANALAVAGRAYHESPVYVLDASNVQPAQVGGLLRAVHDRVRSGARIVVATASPVERPATIPVARGMDGAVLFVELGAAELETSRRAVASIGASHFVGAVTA